MPAIAALGQDDDPLATLARFFVPGLRVPADRLAAALPEFGVDAVIGDGFAADAAGELIPLVELTAHDFVDPAGNIISVVEDV